MCCSPNRFALKIGCVLRGSVPACSEHVLSLDLHFMSHALEQVTNPNRREFPSFPSIFRNLTMIAKKNNLLPELDFVNLKQVNLKMHSL